MNHHSLRRSPAAPPPPTRHRPTAFTLIEVLVVVAIIALLVAILIPTLTRAKEQANRSICMSNLKEMSQATVMYQSDQKGRLPGPIHAAVELKTEGLLAGGDYEEYHLPSFIARYYAERGKGYSTTDRVVSCPTGFKVVHDKLKTTFGPFDDQHPFTYAANTFNSKSYPGFTSDKAGTDSPFYFGYPNHFWTNDKAPPFRQRPVPLFESEPKRVEVVNQPSREWAYGDAFVYKTPLPRAPGDYLDRQWQYGTYQRAWGVGLAPGYQVHEKGIVVAMFDGHSEYQRNWRGTVNSYDPRSTLP